MNKEAESMNFTAVHTEAGRADAGGKTVLRVVKKDKLGLFDQNTYAKIDGLQFHNGVIEVKLVSRLLPDAPDFARGFIGIIFRASA